MYRKASHAECWVLVVEVVGSKERFDYLRMRVFYEMELGNLLTVSFVRKYMTEWGIYEFIIIISGSPEMYNSIPQEDANDFSCYEGYCRYLTKNKIIYR